jgi:hypothetical protein
VRDRLHCAPENLSRIYIHGQEQNAWPTWQHAYGL